MALDALVLCPSEPADSALTDASLRQTGAAFYMLPILRAMAALEAELGRPLGSLAEMRAEDRPHFDGAPLPGGTYSRSNGAVALATSLEAAGLDWEVVDPGVKGWSYWHERLETARERPPLCVVINTTFIVSMPWLQAFCRMIRSLLPKATILVGGYYYGTNAKGFLSIEADVCCVGEGEVRLPAIVKALKDRRPLDGIPGLYLRRPDGTLHYTGHVASLDLNELPRPDWRLAERIEPRIDPRSDAVEFGVETQRGCVFKCEFCTYRTLAELNAMSPEAAVEAILSTALSPRGFTILVDATATFPHDRWATILRLLIERGGSPHPMWCFARVSDLSDDAASLMAQAGVRHLFIGQESADQRILNAMKKGTRVEQIRPALQALRKHGITATMGFIHGFPGEDEASLEATRSLICTVNEDDPERPVVPFYGLNLFAACDLASVSQWEAMKDVHHYYGYDKARFTPELAAKAIVETFLRASKIPEGPAFIYGLLGFSSELPLIVSPRFPQIFRWFKAVDRGVALFLERDLRGVEPDRQELSEVRAEILSRWGGQRPLRSIPERLLARGRRAAMDRLCKECASEPENGVGILTRLLISMSSLGATRDLSMMIRSFRSGNFQFGSPPEDGAARPSVDQQATELATVAIGRAKLVKLSRRERRTQSI